MVKFIASLASLSLAFAASTITDSNWLAYKSKFSKKYSSLDEPRRYEIYAKNMAEIKAHNIRADAGLETFWMGETDFTDRSLAEMKGRNTYGGVLGDNELIQYDCPQSFVSNNSPQPTSKSWIDAGAVTVIKNQMDCGDCWAFSASACMESAYYINSGALNSLSPQQLCDCASSNVTLGDYSTYGCGGGFPQNAFLYAITNGGLEGYLNYPYADMQQYCNYNPSLSIESVSSCVDLPDGDETTMAFAVAQIGPLSVGIDAGLASFHNYVAGIYYAPACSSTELDHAVTVVGYGVLPDVNAAIATTCTTDDFICTRVEEGIEFKYPCFEAPSDTKAVKQTTAIVGQTCNPPANLAGQKFWMVKNSWGIKWGMEGYIMMARDQDNNCGIATSATYAQV